MTPNKVIERVNSVSLDAYSDESKMQWISELDGMVRRLVHQETEFQPYKFPEDMDKELLIPAPFDGLYELYIMSKVDFHNQEWGKYNNSATTFHSLFDDYKKAYIRENMPKSAGNIKI